jgi:ribosomal protein S18 acetylase RimI-like enzyme
VDEQVQLRSASPSDAEAVAALHADSWRRHYRGAYSDEFLDGDILTDRLSVWSARLAEPANGRATILAEADGRLVGFVHVVLDADQQWGSLVDNLHVAHQWQRRGLGSVLLANARQVIARGGSTYLWVLEQNLRAQAFYQAQGGSCVERAAVNPPGGIAGRLSGSPFGLRYVWPDAAGQGANSAPSVPRT